MPLYQFTVIIERQPEGGYLVTVPALPGCYTEGRTLEEAREMAADAIRAYCASLLKHGEPIPVEEALITPGLGDYIQERGGLFAGKTLEQIVSEIEQMRRPD